MHHKPLCPPFSPACHLLTLLKAQRYFSTPPFFSSLLLFPFTFCFALLAFHLLCWSRLFTFLLISPLLSSSCLSSPPVPCPFTRPSWSFLFFPLNSPLFVLASLLILILRLLPCLLHAILSSHLPPPLPSSSSPPAVTPPLAASAHPVMIAEHISFDMKTKGWVHMWFLCKSCVIWNINAGIIWLPGWRVEVETVGAL